MKGMYGKSDIRRDGLLKLKKLKERDIKLLPLVEIRKAIADYMSSEGCSCCQNVDAHDEHKKVLAKLLDVKMYKDKSGYDFYKYKSTKSKGDQS